MRDVADAAIETPAGLQERLRDPGYAMNVALAVLVAVVALSLFISPFRRDLFPKDETRYAELVSEMKTPESLVVLRLDGRIYSDKPPLHFWLLYLFTAIFGEKTAWGYVLPSLLGYILGMFVVRALALRMFGRGALTSMFAFSTLYFNWGVSQIARMDAMYSAFIALGMLMIWRFLDSAESRSLLYAGAAIGVAILTKGPMALLIVVFTLLLEWARRGTLPRGPYAAALALALAIPLAWLVPAGILGGEEYVRQLLVDQNVGRAVHSFIHDEPFWFYAAFFPMIFFPWSPLMIVAALAVWKKAVPQLADGAAFCGSWFLAVIIPFSMISGKLEIYMMPAMAPAAVLVGGFLTARLEGGWARASIVVSRCVAAFAALLFAGAALVPSAIYHSPLARSLVQMTDVRIWLWASCGVSLLMLAGQLTVARRRPVTTAVLSGIAGIFPMIFASLFLAPLLNGLLSTEPLVRALERQKVPWRDVLLVDAPYLWSRARGPEIAHVIHFGEFTLPDDVRRPVLVTAIKEARENDRLAAILREYTLVDSASVRNIPYGIYRRHPQELSTANARTGNVPIPSTFTGTAKKR